MHIRVNDILAVFRLFTNKSMLAIIMIELRFSTTPCHVGVTACWGSQKFTQFLFSAFYLLRNFLASQHITRI